MLAFSIIVSSILLFSCLADAQQRKNPVLGYVSATDRATDFTRAEAIRAGLRKLGYIEGQNVAIEYRYAQGKRDRYIALLAELVRVKPALIIVAGGDPLVRAALKATDAIPIVMTGGGADPVEAGLVESLARPGGNATGITNISTELGGKRLELLKEVVPRLGRVAVLYDSALPASVVEIKEVLPVAARQLKLTLLPWEIGTEKVEKTLASLNDKDARTESTCSVAR